jgi:RNA polymerase sigma-70 factor (ECF subfamily)
MSAAVDPYILQQASFQASLLVSTAAFMPDDWEDLRQEMVLDLLRRAPKFDPRRGDWQGFVRGIVRHHAAVLVNRHRRRALEVLRDDSAVEEDADRDDSIEFRAECWPQTVDELNLNLDVRRVVESLPVRLRSLAVLLGQMPVKEVCQATGRSRSGVFQMTRQIREAFVDAGLVPRSRVRRRTSSPKSAQGARI